MADETIKKLVLNLKYELARCGGLGYFIMPADQTVWDVPSIRVDCRGCKDCKPVGVKNDLR